MSRLSLLLLAILVPTALRAQTPARTTAIPDQTLSNGGTVATVDLKTHFEVTGMPATPLALFETVAGNFYVELLSGAAPKHVDNFKAYANEGAYDTSFIHRSSSLELDSTGQLPDITKPSKVIQGGAYRIFATGYGDSIRAAISTKPAVALEYSQANARGTLAAARGSAVNSATSQWFFNVADNTAPLGQVNGTGGYTVFGRVMGDGMTVVDALATLPRFRYSDQFTEFPLRNYTSGPVRDQNLALIQRVRVVTAFPADASTPGAVRFEATSSARETVEAKVLGSTLQLVPKAPGTATITVNALNATGASVASTFTVTVTAPQITASPVSRTVAPGGSVTFAVTASGTGALAYQWQKDGAAIAGATGAELTLNNVSAADAGSYTVVVSEGTASTISREAKLLVATPQPAALANLSVRSNSSPLLIGFGTSGERQLLVRGIGPSLNTLFGLTDAMPNPKVEVVVKNSAGQDSIIATNDNWGTNAAALEPVFAQVGAFGLPNTTTHDAAALVSLNGLATVSVARSNGRDGIALAEIYDRAPGQGGRLVNLSARAWVGSGDNVVIVGFIISGNQPRRVLVRAVGPTLGTDFNIYGALPDPVLEIHQAVGGQDRLIARNDDWQAQSELAGITSAGFQLPDGSRDAAMVLTLPAGAYTAVVRAQATQFGVALVELYDLD